MSDYVPKVEEFLADQKRILKHDPFADRELELKLSVVPTADPFALLQTLRSQLMNKGLGPFVFDSFGYDMRQIVHHVFSVVGREGKSEAFVVMNTGTLWSIRMKKTILSTPNNDRVSRWPLEPYILDRHEEQTFDSTVTFPAFLAFAERVLHEYRDPPRYLGNFLRDAVCIACLNRDTGHRYAIIGDRSRFALSGAILQQLELEYIWKREPFHRPFTPEELRSDLAHLGQLILETFMAQPSLVEPTRTTKFEWMSHEAEAWIAAPQMAAAQR